VSRLQKRCRNAADIPGSDQTDILFIVCAAPPVLQADGHRGGASHVVGVAVGWECACMWWCGLSLGSCLAGLLTACSRGFDNSTAQHSTAHHSTARTRVEDGKLGFSKVIELLNRLLK